MISTGLERRIQDLESEVLVLSYLVPLLTSQPEFVILNRVKKCITVEGYLRSQMRFHPCRYFVNSRAAMQMLVIFLADTLRLGPSFSPPELHKLRVTLELLAKSPYLKI